MKKCYFVSGKKNSIQKFQVFPSRQKAEEALKNVEFQRGWRSLGISEINCKQGKKIEKDIGSRIIRK